MSARAFTPATQLGRDTLDQLWTRTRQQGDMPGFASAINAILGAMRGEEDINFNMARTVLSDPVLTHKVLRLANSGMYSAFGQSVNTVSQAVLVLGTDAIGHLALGLKPIEDLAGVRPESVSAHIEMEKAVLAGMVARQVAASTDSAHAEQAVVCSMLHTLGRMMLTFYMSDHWAGLQAHAGPGNESAAAPAVLGLTLQEIGRATAEHWGLPQDLISGMRTVEPPAPGTDISVADWLAGLSTMSALCADSLWHDNPAGAAEVLELIERYSGMLGVEPDGLVAAIEKARVMAAADLSIAPMSKPAERRARALKSSRMRAEGNQVLVGGLAAMRGGAGHASLSKMMSLALETAYCGLDLSRAVGFARSHKKHAYCARTGLGEGIVKLLPLMEFGEAYEPNVFHAALNSDRVIFIDNARDPAFAAKLPQWWKTALSEARAFVILPLCVNGRPAGFIYGDWNDSFPPIQLSQTEFALLNDLRALVVKSVGMRA